MNLGKIVDRLLYFPVVCQCQCCCQTGRRCQFKLCVERLSISFLTEFTTEAEFLYSHFEPCRKGDCFFSRGENVRKAKSLFWQPCGKRQGGEVQPTKVLQWVLMQSAIATIPMTHCEHPLPPKHHRFAPQESQAADSRLSGVGLQ